MSKEMELAINRFKQEAYEPVKRLYMKALEQFQQEESELRELELTVKKFDPKGQEHFKNKISIERDRIQKSIKEIEGDLHSLNAPANLSGENIKITDGLSGGEGYREVLIILTQVMPFVPQALIEEKLTQIYSSLPQANNDSHATSSDSIEGTFGASAAEETGINGLAGNMEDLFVSKDSTE